VAATPEESEGRLASSIQELYGDLWGKARAGFDERISQSLNPRDPDMLDELFGKLGVSQDDTVLDVGCRDALHSVLFVQRFGCHVIAVDPIPLHMDWAAKRVAEAGLEARITLMLGRPEELPLDDCSIDHVWCRDVLNHVDFQKSLSECFRVLQPGGTMLLYQTFATGLLEPKEAARLFQALAIVHDNMACDYFDQAARRAGFETIQKDKIDSEWRENGLENGWGSLDEALLRLARMRRLEDDLVRDYGRGFYEAAYADSLWNVYQVLGKLCSIVHVLKRRLCPDAHVAKGT
jgi:ubiquinone/menaquinone biosynthesis C-methylase UbiE